MGGRRRHAARTLALTALQRALLYQALARLERVGITPDHGLAALQQAGGRRLRPALGAFARRVATGTPPWQAGRDAGLFLPWEARLLRVAADSGTLDRVLERLATHWQDRDRWRRRMRSRLALPLFLLLLLLFLAPLPALVGGRLDGAGYLLRTLLPLAVLALLALAFTQSLRRRTGSDLAPWLERGLLLVPGLGRLLLRRAQRDLVLHLGLLLAAGLPAITAMREAATTVRNPRLRGAWTLAAADVEAGMTVVDALAAHGALDGNQGVPLALAGEASGRLDLMLQHHAKQLDQRLALVDGALAEWLPRLLYLGVLGLLSWAILGNVL